MKTYFLAATLPACVLSAQLRYTAHGANLYAMSMRLLFGFLFLDCSRAARTLKTSDALDAAVRFSNCSILLWFLCRHLRQPAYLVSIGASCGNRCVWFCLTCPCTLSLLAVAVVFLLRSIHWEPVASGSQTVKFTLRTAWERSAGVYTKLVKGIPQVFAGDGMYQPVKGDRIKVLGPETPKFIVSNGLFREYLELTVTYNTEQVLKGNPTGTNLPHAAPHWSYEGTNWFEGITEWEIELPDSEKTYVAELQGCCRVNQMAHMQSNQGCIETMYGRGVLQLCETPFFLRSTVNLQYVPPPVSFLPQMLTYSFLNKDSTLTAPLELPILDYRATRKGMVKIPEQPVTWPDQIRVDEEEAGGILYKPAPIVVENPPEELVAVRRQVATSESSESSSSRSSRHLLAGHMEDGEPVDLEPLPKFPTPPANKNGVEETFYKVHTTASGTGVSLRMLDIESSQHLTLYSSLSCSGDHLRIPPGSDVCEHSFVPMYDCEHGQGRVAVEKCFEGSSSRVTGNVHSIMVPAGLTVHFSDKCETSDPYALDNVTILGGCNNAMGASAMCCNVTSADVRTFRASKPSGATKCIQQATSCSKDLTNTLSMHEALTIGYSPVSKEGVVSTLVYRPAIPRELMEGNYPVTLMIGTKSSGITMVEFILKVGSISLGASQVIPGIMGVTNIPTNFEYHFGWEFTGEMSSNGNIFFQTLDDGGYLFESRPSVVNIPLDSKNLADASDDVPAYGTFKWTPCLADAGLYYYCMSAVSIPAKELDGSIYRWSDVKCVTLRVVEDLPPKVSFYYKDTPFHDQDTYHLYMGQRLEAVVNASDNFQDTIDILVAYIYHVYLYIQYIYLHIHYVNLYTQYTAYST